MRLGIIGGGKAAWAFGRSLQRAGWSISGVTLRPGSASPLPDLLGAERRSIGELARESDLLFAAVSDSALEEIGRDLAPLNVPSFHASGFHPSSILGGRAFSLHPLRSLPACGAEVSLAETILTYEGSDEMVPIARAIVTAVDGRLARIAAESKPLYHSAAVFAANYVGAICQLAATLLTKAGIETDVREAVERLAKSAIENWSERGIDGFTGPLVRRDAAVVEAHLGALSGDPEARDLYVSLGLEMISQLAGQDADHPDFQEIARRLRALRVP